MRQHFFKSTTNTPRFNSLRLELEFWLC